MYHYTYRQHDARLGQFWSVDPLARKYPWNSPYAFAENDVVSSVELEGLESWRVNTSISITFGGDSRSRAFSYLTAGVGGGVDIPLSKETGLMIMAQIVWRGYQGGLGGLDQPERMRFQTVTSIGLGYGQGNAPEMYVYPFHSRMPSLWSTSREKVRMYALNYIAERGRSQRVGAFVVRSNNTVVVVYNDLFAQPGRDRYETGGLWGSRLFPNWPREIGTLYFGAEVYTDEPTITTDQYGIIREAAEEGPDGKLYYKVRSPELNAGWLFGGLRGTLSNGFNWCNWDGRFYVLGGNKLGMASQRVIHKYISRDPYFYSPHPPAFGFGVGAEQPVRIGP